MAQQITDLLSDNIDVHMATNLTFIKPPTQLNAKLAQKQLINLFVQAHKETLYLAQVF